MKRYRFANFFFDGTRNLLRDDKLPVQIREKEQKQLRDGLAHKYGDLDLDGKIERYLEFDPPNVCIISEYLNLLLDIADTYVCGNYYPALTGACSLGERIFNILILKLRDNYKVHSLYKKVYEKESLQEWGKAIDILKQWKLIDSELEHDYRKLASLRNESIHFSDIKNIRKVALAALKIVMKITDSLFGLGSDIFFWCPGELYVKKEKEGLPFVKDFIIPNCVLLGYKHEVKSPSDSRSLAFVYQDCDDYEQKDVSDQEFRELRIAWSRSENSEEKQ